MIEACEWQDVLPWRTIAARESVSLSDTKRTRWFRWIYGERQVAVAGLIEVAGRRRIKGVFVLPDERGLGIGTQLTSHLIELAQEPPQPLSVDAFALNEAFYIDRGWKRVGVNAHGYPLVRLELAT